MGDDLALKYLFPLTRSSDSLTGTFAGVEGDENVGRLDKEEVAGACTVICKHLRILECIRYRGCG